MGKHTQGVVPSTVRRINSYMSACGIFRQGDPRTIATFARLHEKSCENCKHHTIKPSKFIIVDKIIDDRPKFDKERRELCANI